MGILLVYDVTNEVRSSTAAPVLWQGPARMCDSIPSADVRFYSWRGRAILFLAEPLHQQLRRSPYDHSSASMAVGDIREHLGVDARHRPARFRLCQQGARAATAWVHGTELNPFPSQPLVRAGWHWQRRGQHDQSWCKWAYGRHSCRGPVRDFTHHAPCPLLPKPWGRCPLLWGSLRASSAHGGTSPSPAFRFCSATRRTRVASWSASGV